MISSLEDQLRRDEANRQFAYDDDTGGTLLRGGTLKGNLTIGVGRNLSAKGLSQKERDFLLANDIQDATAALEMNFPWTAGLDPVRKGALLNMIFNEGPAHLASFHDAMSKMQAGDYKAAAAAFLDSLWAKQVGPRATRLSIQIESGFWQ
jgi:lysozyme